MRSRGSALNLESESDGPDGGVADAYRAASDVIRTTESLHDVMEEITQNARACGLTPEILEEFLPTEPS